MNLELSEEELHDLYDMLYMMEAGVIQVNGCQESWNSIFNRIEPLVVPELYDSSSTKNEQEVKDNGN